MPHCHTDTLNIEVPDGARKIVLAGNPNAGKSVVFNALTGLYVDVSNYPGTTLEISHGRLGKDILIDTPGVYGISSFNDEERIARDIILEADIVINVVNAVLLERDLFLTQQVIDTGVPVVVALNMVDEARKQGISIDIDLLSDLLGVEVIPTIAVAKEGLDKVKDAIDHAREGHIDPWLKTELNKGLNTAGSQGEALLILEGDPVISERHGVLPGSYQAEIYENRRKRVNDIIGHVVSETGKGAGLSTVVGRLALRPVTGIPIMILLLWAMYKIIGGFIAGTVVGITEETIMVGHYEPAVRHIVESFLQSDSVFRRILVGEFGLLTMTVTYTIGLLMPLVVGFYFFLSLFEDSGYLPRLATLVDRIMMAIGLNGRAIIPIILGFGCVTMATVTTRLLGSDRERKIAVFLLGLAIPCSAQLGVIAGMLAEVGTVHIALYVLTILLVLGLAGVLLSRVVPGKSTDLMIDLPPMRLPRLENVAKKTMTKSVSFLIEAAPLFALGALLITILQETGALTATQKLLAPLTVSWLGLPREAATAFIMGLVRRDFGAAGLTAMTLSPLQTVVALTTITLFVPCIASVLVIFKERGKSEALLLWLGSWIIAFIIGGLVSKFGILIGV